MAPPPAQPDPPTTPSTPAPPPPPSPDASRAEWHAWRHAQRAYVRAQIRGRPYWVGGWGYRPGWGLFWPLVFILLGVYLLLSNLGLLGWLRGDVVWPVLLILLGVALIIGRGRWWR